VITQQRVRELFEYRCDGTLVRRSSASSNTKPGDVAGSAKGLGYLGVTADRKSYYVHRLVWLYHNGYFPEHGIDHINRNKKDNRIENLREVSQSCNIKNSLRRPNKTSGIRGVNWSSGRQKWCAMICNKGKVVNLGRCYDKIEAVCLRLAAEQCAGWGSCNAASPAKKFVTQFVQQQKGVVK